MSTELENAYMQDYANSFFPPDAAAEDLPELVQMRPGAMDAEMKAIPQTGLQKVMEQTGLTLEEIGKGLEGLGSVKIGGFEISLRDILPFVGSSEKKTDPVTGEETIVQTGTPAALQQLGQGVSATTGTGFARQLRPDMKAAVFDALDLAGVAKVATTGVKAAAKALAPKAAEMAEDFLTKRGMLLQFGPDGKQVEIPAAPKLETPAFKNWFGDSKVVDEDGKPLVVYHGTTKDFAEFRASFAEGQGKGIYFSSDPTDMLEFSEGIGGQVLPVYLKIKKPYRDGESINGVMDETRFFEDMEYRNKELQRLGYDGVISPQGNGLAGNEIVVFNPEQVKSVFNKGTWDPKDPRMSYGVGAGGAGAASQQEDK